jgi:hypothetical protein
MFVSMRNLLESKLRFLFWLILFFGLLIFIPITLQNDFNGIAKGMGVIVIMLLFVALSVWRHQTLKKKAKAAPVHLNANDRFWLNQHLFFYKCLSTSDRMVFENRLGLFLSNVEFRAERKELLDKSAYLYVASSVVMSFWPFHFMDYQKISAVVLNDSQGEGLLIEPDVERPLMNKKYFIKASLPMFRAVFEKVHFSENEVTNLKSFLEDGLVSSESFPSIASSQIRNKWFELVEFSNGNECYDEMYAALQENKLRFLTRYPGLSARMGV